MSAEKFGRREYWEMAQSTGRSFEAYKYFLDLKEDDLKGKRILDLGSGKGEEFKEGVKINNIDAEVISLNPKLGLETKEGGMARRVSTKEKVVAGISQELPFQDKTFDLILSLDAVPLYLSGQNGDEEYMESFREIDRVLRDGGMMKIYPIKKYQFEKESSKDLPPLERPLNYLEKKGYKIFRKEIKVDQELMEKYKTTGGWQLVLKKPEKD